MNIRPKHNGFSLIEMLVVVSIFAILAVVATQAVVLSLRSARKSDSILDVRGNLDFAVLIIEKSLRNAKFISSCTTTPPLVEYIDEHNRASSFGCRDLDGDGYVEIASESARLTSENIKITNCEIICTSPTSGATQYLDISVSGVTTEAQGIEVSPVTIDTRINLRVY